MERVALGSCVLGLLLTSREHVIERIVTDALPEKVNVLLLKHIHYKIQIPNFKNKG